MKAVTADVYTQVANKPRTRTFVSTINLHDEATNERIAAAEAKVSEAHLVAVQKRRAKGRLTYTVITW